MPQSSLQQMHLLSLPVELLYLIAEFLPPKGHLELAGTSKLLWYLLSARAVMRRRYWTIAAVDDEWIPDRPFLIKAIPYVENLIIDIVRHAAPSTENLIAAVNNKSLDDLFSSERDDISLDYVSIFLPKLFYLQVAIIPLNPMWRNQETWDIIISANLLRNLTYVDINSRSFDDFHDDPSDDLFTLGDFLQLCRLPSLRSLYLEDVRWDITYPQTLPPPALKDSVKLEILQFSGSNISCEYWRPILENIQSLKMFSYESGDPWVTDNEWCHYPLIKTLLEFHKQSLHSLRLYNGIDKTCDHESYPTGPINGLGGFLNLIHLSCGWQEIVLESEDHSEDHNSLFLDRLPPSLQTLHYQNMTPGWLEDDSYEMREQKQLIEYINSPNTKLQSLTLENYDEAVIQAARKRGIVVDAPVRWSVGRFMELDNDGAWRTEFDRTYRLNSP